MCVCGVLCVFVCVCVCGCAGVLPFNLYIHRKHIDIVF